MEFLFPTPSLVCSATALRFTRVFFLFFFFAFVPEIEIISIRLARPGISAYLYTESNAYLLYRVTEDIVPENGKCPAPSGPSRMISRRVANGLTMASNHRPTIKN